MSIGIYKITSPTSKIYVGQSEDLERRKEQYRRVKEAVKQIRLYHSLRKHGWDTHIFEVLEECLKEELNNRERYWQEFYDVTGKMGLNCVLVETNEKLRSITPETKQKMSNSKKGNTYMRGKTMPLEAVKEMTIKNSIVINQYNLNGDFIREWHSQSEAARVLNISRGGILNCCKEKTKTCGGFIWKYKDI